MRHYEQVLNDAKQDNMTAAVIADHCMKAVILAEEYRTLNHSDGAERELMRRATVIEDIAGDLGLRYECTQIVKRLRYAFDQDTAELEEANQ